MLLHGGRCQVSKFLKYFKLLEIDMPHIIDWPCACSSDY